MHPENEIGTGLAGIVGAALDAARVPRIKPCVGPAQVMPMTPQERIAVLAKERDEANARLDAFVDLVMADTHEFRTWQRAEAEMIEGQEREVALDHNRMLDTLLRFRRLAQSSADPFRMRDVPCRLVLPESAFCCVQHPTEPERRCQLPKGHDGDHQQAGQVDGRRWANNEHMKAAAPGDEGDGDAS